MEPSLPTARGLAIAGEWIAGGVGTHETALASPDRVDVGGRCVVPGFTDSHVHFPTWAMAQHEVRLEGTRSLEEALARVREALAEVRPGRWLLGRGWRSGDWQPRVEPTKERLDELAGETPVALMARDSHSVWLSSAALARANGDLHVPGGVVEVDEHGEPTGVLREESCWHFRDAYIETTDDEYVEAMRTAIKLANSRGVTAVHDKDGWLGAPRFWQRLDSEGALTLRVWQSLPAEKVDDLAALGIASGFGGPRLEHAQLLAPEDVGRFAQLGVATSVQFSHAPSDRDLADRLWAAKTDGAYAFRSLWDSGALLANGSDAPIEELDPLAGIRAGVLRTLDDRPAWHPGQALTVEQALTASTVNPAWLAGDERRRGKLLPGQYADLVVLDRDPVACAVEELPEVLIVATMLGGNWVHNPPPWD